MTPEHLAELEAMACDSTLISISLSPITLQELTAAARELASAKQTIAELGMDKERLDWLEGFDLFASGDSTESYDFKKGDGLRKAIDAALSAKGPDEQS